MILTPAKIYDRLVKIDGKSRSEFTLITDTSESDVQKWYDKIDVSKLESEADSQIDRTVITDLTEGDIGPDSLSIEDCIKSRGDDPRRYKAAYIIETDRTFIQYFRPKADGKNPMSQSGAKEQMRSHVNDLIDRAVNDELLTRAKAEFSA